MRDAMSQFLEYGFYSPLKSPERNAFDQDAVMWGSSMNGARSPWLG